MALIPVKKRTVATIATVTSIRESRDSATASLCREGEQTKLAYEDWQGAVTVTVRQVDIGLDQNTLAPAMEARVGYSLQVPCCSAQAASILSSLGHYPASLTLVVDLIQHEMDLHLPDNILAFDVSVA
jgi:hypothetical protein